MTEFTLDGNLFWNALGFKHVLPIWSVSFDLGKTVVPKVLCLDSSVIIPYLVPEKNSQKAEVLVQDAILSSIRVVAPCFAWAEVGSVLLKKVRRKLLTGEESQACFKDFEQLPLEFIDHPDLRNKAWAIAAEHGLTTLYDAAFLACAEHCGAEFWTADQVLVKSLSPCPTYVRSLSDS